MDKQLSGRDLDRAIAGELFGIENIIEVGTCRELRRLIPVEEHGYPHGNSKEIPVYHADANAVLEVCLGRGWKLHFDPDGTEVRVPAERVRDERWYIGVGGATPQENAARSLLAALQTDRQ